MPYLLMQVRDDNDPMRAQEVRCFARVLNCEPEAIQTVDLLTGGPSVSQLEDADVVFLGGSGDYSVAKGGPWLSGALEVLSRLYDESKPTFASCWGFQAMARAMGGEVVTDLKRAEIGTIPVRLTQDGMKDPLFSSLSEVFSAQMGHQDVVVSLPRNSTLLASSELVKNQAFRFDGKPIYCTQFHPELNAAELKQRATRYPEYLERIMGATLDEFEKSCHDSPETEALLPRFVREVIG